MTYQPDHRVESLFFFLSFCFMSSRDIFVVFKTNKFYGPPSSTRPAELVEWIFFAKGGSGSAKEFNSGGPQLRVAETRQVLMKKMV